MYSNVLSCRPAQGIAIAISALFIATEMVYWFSFYGIVLLVDSECVFFIYRYFAMLCEWPAPGQSQGFPGARDVISKSMGDIN